MTSCLVCSCGVRGCRGACGEIWAIKWGEGRLGPVLGCRAACEVCPAPWWCSVRGSCIVPGCHSSTVLLLPAPQKWQLGFWSFGILLSIRCPNCTCTQLFLVPYYFFVFCWLKAVFVQVQALQQRVLGPRSQPVSG